MGQDSGTHPLASAGEYHRQFTELPWVDITDPENLATLARNYRPSASSGFFEDVVNATVNIATGGLVGYENGRATKGALVRGVDETIGELSGRNAARKALMEQKDAAEVAKTEQIAEMKREQTRKFQQDVQASQYAGSVRRTAAARQKSLLGSGPERDFLGL